MKTRTLLIAIAFLFIGSSTQAQFFKKLGKAAEKAAERAVTKKTEQKVTKETEKAMDTVLGNGNKKEKKKKKRSSKTNRNGEGSENQNHEPSSDTNETTENDAEKRSTKASSTELKAWSKYNFVPGDKIIFEDDLASEENGEFPSRWDLSQGSAENAKMGNENIINFENKSIITPLLETENYLPEVFTLEFDVYFNDSGPTYQSYDIRFWQGTSNLDEGSDRFWPIRIFKNGAKTTTRIKDNTKNFAGYSEESNKKTGWKHIAISFNKRSLKVFVDEYRALNIPNYGYLPKMFSVGSYYWSTPKTMAIKNIRIAEGGKKLYDRIMADGKFVTRGILFDVNKASLKPSSMGVINQVAKMMNEHADLKFSIEGHTDSDGEEASNLKLSEKRAAAVKEALANAGVDSSRLQVKGMGESIPVSDNTTAEGKANNRRVEFLKI